METPEMETKGELVVVAKEAGNEEAVPVLTAWLRFAYFLRLGLALFGLVSAIHVLVVELLF